MADAVGTVRVDLFANLADWSGGLDKATGQLNRFARNTDKIAKGFEKTGRAMTTALTLPLVAFGGFAIKAAAEAQDLQGAFNVTFGDAAKDATEWARITGDAMGRSTQTIQKGAIAFSEFFEDFAPNEQSALELSKAFTVLTQDFAAFRNVSDDQAQSVLLKGLAGSARGLKALGVDISDAALQTKAFELGIAGANDELTEQQKVLARASIIMAGTAKMQGEVARSAGETEQETRKAREEFNELLVTVGEQLLPVFNEFLKLSLNVLNSFNSLDDGGKRLVLTVAAIAAAAGPAVLVLGGVFKAVSFGAKSLAVLSKVGAGAISMFGALAAPSVASAKGIAATGAAAGAAVPNVQKLGLSIQGALGWFLALAPAAYAAGNALGTAFKNTELDTQRVIAQQIVEALKRQGLTAQEAAAGASYYYKELAKGNKVSEAAIIAHGKLGAAVSGPAHDAFRKSIDDAIDESIAMGEANKAAADLKTEIDNLLGSFGNLSTPVAATAEELQRVRDAADPIGASLREYAANLKLARAAGVDAAVAQRVFGQAAVDSITDVANFRDELSRLPPELQAIVRAEDDLANKTAGFGAALEKGLASRKATQDFGKELAKGLKEAKDEIVAFGADLTDQFDPAAKFAEQMKRIEAAYKAGAISADVYAAARKAAFEETPQGAKELATIKERGEFIGELADAAADAADNTRNFGESISQLVVETLKANVIKPFFQDLFNQVIPGKGQGQTGQTGIDFGAVLSGIGGLFGFGGTRDSGGDAYPGMSYRIGSGVQETFVPDQPGKIVRGNAGGNGPTVIQNFNGNDVGQYRASRRQLARESKRAFA